MRRIVHDTAYQRIDTSSYMQQPNEVKESRQSLIRIVSLVLSITPSTSFRLPKHGVPATRTRPLEVFLPEFEPDIPR